MIEKDNLGDWSPEKDCWTADWSPEKDDLFQSRYVTPGIYTTLYCILVVGRLKLSHSGFTSISNLFFLEANCTVLANLFHSLDIWHKSIKLTAKISAVSISGLSNIID